MSDVLMQTCDVGVARGKRWILRGVNLSISPRGVYGILGPNGSGKSTLSRLMAGQIWPTRGEVQLSDGQSLAPAPTVKHLVRTVQPSNPLDFEPGLTAEQIVLTGFFGTLGVYHVPTFAMRRRARSLMASIGLSELADSAYGVMSTGEKVRTLIARAMAIRPRLLILDEPTSGLDLLAREQVLATVRKILRKTRDTAAVLITHHVEEFPPGTREVLVLSHGEVIAQGPPAEAITSQTLSRAFGVPVEVHRRHRRFYTTVHPRAWDALNGISS